MHLHEQRECMFLSTSLKIAAWNLLIEVVMLTILAVIVINILHTVRKRSIHACQRLSVVQLTFIPCSKQQLHVHACTMQVAIDILTSTLLGKVHAFCSQNMKTCLRDVDNISTSMLMISL